MSSLGSDKSMKRKRILLWSDSVTATTGFGIVSKHIAKALYSTGRYDIDQLAINFFEDFYDRNRYPYNITPARLGDPKDPYGNQTFLNALQKHDYDIVLVINDTFVVEKVAGLLDKFRYQKIWSGQKVFRLIYYYPVDCKLLPQYSTMIKIADRAVAYTNFAAESTASIDMMATDVIYHGTDIQTYHSLDKEDRLACRKKYFGVEDDTFIIVNVNRNSIRKNLATTILAFSEFRKRVPNSKLYLHASPVDGTHSNITTDLNIPIKELGLEVNKDILFPHNYDVAKGFPASVLNQLYNCGDMYMTTHLGEGWGLSVSEAMAAGLPVVAPRSTSMPEILGQKSERGYLYDCKEKVYIDGSGYRPTGRLEDVLSMMFRCYEDKQHKEVDLQTKIDGAKEFTKKYSWNNVCKHWVKLFREEEQALQKQIQSPAMVRGVTI